MRRRFNALVLLHTTIRILAVEDDPVQALSVGILLRALGYELVGVAPTAEEALVRFEEEQPDLVLLDINLAGDRDGVELAHALVQRRPVPLIFVTAYPDQDTFARARQVGPFAFLGKPYNGPLLGHSIELALQHFATALGLPPDPGAQLPDGAVLLGGVFVREGGRLLKIRLADVLLIEADNAHCHLHTAAGRHHTVRVALKDLEERLPAGAFVQVHRSFVVAVRAIAAVAYETLTLTDGRAVPLGRTYRPAVLAALARLG